MTSPVDALLFTVPVIFLLLTLRVWTRTLHPLERFGWVSGTIVAIIAIVTWVMPDVPFVYRGISGLVAIAILGIALTWPHLSKIGKQHELTIDFDVFHDSRKSVSMFDFTVECGDKKVDALEVQVAHGYKLPFDAWANLDLRRYAIEEVEKGKDGQAVTRIEMLRHSLRRFTFVTVWADNDKRTIMRVVDDSNQAVPMLSRWISPYPELFVKFVGLENPMEKRYIVVFHKPPWISRTKDGKPSNRPAELVDADSERGRKLLIERDSVLVSF